MVDSTLIHYGCPKARDYNNRLQFHIINSGEKTGIEIVTKTIRSHALQLYNNDDNTV